MPLKLHDTQMRPAHSNSESQAHEDCKGSVTQSERLASEVDIEVAGVSERITAMHHPKDDDQMAITSSNGGPCGLVWEEPQSSMWQVTTPTLSSMKGKGRVNPMQPTQGPNEPLVSVAQLPPNYLYKLSLSSLCRALIIS